MHDQFVAGKSLEQRSQRYGREGINEFVPRGGADLNQTNLFGIGVQAVSLSVHGHPRRGPNNGQENLKLLLCINHLSNIIKIGSVKANVFHRCTRFVLAQ